MLPSSSANVLIPSQAAVAFSCVSQTEQIKQKAEGKLQELHFSPPVQLFIA